MSTASSLGLHFSRQCSLKMDWPKGAASRCDRADFQPQENQAVQKRRAAPIGGLALVERVGADFFPRHHLFQLQPLELLVEIVDDRQAADAVGHPAQPRADVDFVDGLQEMGGVGPRVALAAASNQGVEDVVQDRRRRPRRRASISACCVAPIASAGRKRVRRACGPP